ncbi:hypothetical protein [Actinomadura montaniterrae]|uniref:Uncharacterized protein n=1 Tax=Actinomadura montaniterrae TaxID=1803903 RepID=A0A6L3W6U6_9ACTN|nr:hypothetical protein [Actinomadura montaniterrae]KAB2386145.1 hypothetical protein F9B16_08375 [Actinomadura montaniterrae]
MSTLEDRYRRLLACYPAAHREAHGEEMLDVLLASARPGQTRPSLADTADLLLGAARIRLRRAMSGPRTSLWPDALAITGFLAMLLLMVEAARFAVDVPTLVDAATAQGHGTIGVYGLLYFFGTGPYWLAWTVIAVLAWRGHHRRAAIGACAVTAAQVAFAAYGTAFQDYAYAYLGRDFAGTSLPLALLATASLTVSPGPRRGARLLGRARLAGAATVAAVLLALHTYPAFSLLTGGRTGVDPRGTMDGLIAAARTMGELRAAGALVTAVLAAAALARDRTSRRAFVLLALAGAPALVNAAGDALPDSVPAALMLLPGSLLVGMAGLVVAGLCVRLVESPAGTRARRRVRSSA